MLTEAFLQKLQTYALQMEGRVQGGGGGNRRSKELGSSLEFSDFREYVPGDDLRRLDWTAYARTDKLYMKQFLDTQDSYVSVILDASRSMEPKWEAAQDLAMGLGYLALSGGDRMQILSVGESIRYSASFYARRDSARAAQFLHTCHPTGTRLLPDAMRSLQIHRRGLSILITDGYGDDAVLRSIDILHSQRQQVILIHVLSESETDPRLQGALRLTDSETDKVCDLVLSEDTLHIYRQNLAAFLQKSQEVCQKRGVRYVLFDQEPIQDIFLTRLGKARVIAGA